MSADVGLPGLLKEKMQSGINLFTGAGFSCLPDLLGKSLPTAKELCEEICLKFNLPNTFIDDLESLSALAPKQQLQEYLRSRFTISTYSSTYDI